MIDRDRTALIGNLGPVMAKAYPLINKRERITNLTELKEGE